MLGLKVTFPYNALTLNGPSQICQDDFIMENSYSKAVSLKALDP
jgi:hypothetical protein